MAEGGPSTKGSDWGPSQGTSSGNWFPSNPLADAMTLGREIASKSPDAVRGAKQLMNRLLNDGAAGQFAAERETIHQLIGKPNQVEAVMSHFEKREPIFRELG